jgi:phenylacetate-CoA ligase
MLNLTRISFYLFEAMRRATWSRQRLVDYQNRQLRKVVRYAFDNVPFYHRLFKTVNVAPSEIRCAKDLNKLPVVRKSDLRKEPYRDLISSEFVDRRLKTLKTGGSTGEPFMIYISEKEDERRMADCLRSNIICGQRPLDRWVAVLDADRSRDHAKTLVLIHQAVRVFFKQIVPVTWNRVAQLNAVERLKPDILDGFPNALWLLAREMELRDRKLVHPRVVFGSGEPVSTSLRRYLENAFDAPYYDQFGCMEIDRSAWQCPENNAYHIDMDSVAMQFIGSDGEEVGSGERGEVVYTSLFNYAMPFIRYGTRDICTPLDESCPCGRALPMMRVVQGRDNSFLVFADGHIVSPMSFIEILKAFLLVKEIEQYQVVQNGLNKIDILVKKAHKDVDESHLRDWLLANISHGLPRVENVDLSGVTFNVKFVDKLSLTPRGKLNVVTSNLNAFNQNSKD